VSLFIVILFAVISPLVFQVIFPFASEPVPLALRLPSLSTVNAASATFPVSGTAPANIRTP
jgi:hypothetical protein